MITEFIEWWKNLLYDTGDVTVEYAITSYFESVEEKFHDECAIIPGKYIIRNVKLSYPQFSHMDIRGGLEQLVFEGKVYEVYPDEFRRKKDKKKLN